MTPATADLLAKIEELEETIEQMKRAWAPPLMFPIAWNIRESGLQILRALATRKMVTAGEHLMTGVRSRKNESPISKDSFGATIHHIRQQWRAVSFDMVIHNEHAVGWYIEPKDQARLLAIATEEAKSVPSLPLVDDVIRMTQEAGGATGMQFFNLVVELRNVAHALDGRLREATKLVDVLSRKTNV